MCAQQPIAPARANARAAELQKSRITSLLEQLADQSRASENLAFATRAQAQAATLLWPHDSERARSIYRRAFKSLAGSLNTPAAAATPALQATQPDRANRPKAPVLNPAQKRQLRSELLNQIAARDPELAEELARDLADSIETSKTGCGECASESGLSRASFGSIAASTREAAEQRELLMSAALQVVERNPQQAMAFAQMSVALGISSNFARLLMLMRTVDAERADLLFSNAVTRLEQSPRADLAAAHTLGSYVLAVVNSATKQPLDKALVIRFLNLAFEQIADRGSSTPRSASRDDSASLYFIERQLTDLFARYLPDRLDQLQRYVSDQADAGASEAIDPRELGVRGPADIARDAIEATNAAERDSLYAGAALGWLAGGSVKEAQAAALRITDDRTRDRVLVQIVRRHSSDKRIEDAVALTRRITDAPSRADLLVMISTALLASKDRARAIELLNEAEVGSLKTPPSIERARSLVKIAGSFAGFDPLRSFDTLQSAVKTINEITRQEEFKIEPPPASARAAAAASLTLDELHAASFEKTLAALARVDFERALFLAQQFAGEEASVIAQLAVCGGGLVETLSAERLASDEETASGFNQR